MNTIIEQTFGHETVRIEPWGPDAVRVRATVNAGFKEWPGALLPPSPVTAVRVQRHGTTTVLENGRLRVELGASGALRFVRADSGAVLLEEPVAHGPHPGGRQYRAVGGELHRLEVRFLAKTDERFYGLGQHRNGRLNQKGCVIDLVQRNTEVAIPFVVSSAGYGFLWHHPGVGRVELGHHGTRWLAEGAAQVDYWVTVGDRPAEILRRYAEATGFPPLLPEWATGFWQSKLRYRSQAELLGVAREYRRRELPLSVIVIDFFHWPMMGDLQFDARHWPDPAAMVRELASLGVKVMVSVWPSFNPASRNFAEFRDRGWLVRTERGGSGLFPFFDVAPDGPVTMHYYDPSHPEARRRFWELCREGYRRHGIEVFWLDACEPEIVPVHHDNLRFHQGPGVEVAGLYPWWHQQAFGDGLRAEGVSEPVLLCRSAWAGSQRFGAAVWSGDIPSTFAELAIQVRAGLNMAMSGIPWWTTDIGGFYGGDPSSEEFRELIVRWFQYGVFCPLCRLHGVREPVPSHRDSGAPNEVWSFGERAYAILREWLGLRERLRPYLHEQMRVAHRTGLSVMRPVFVDFADDKTAWEMEDEFLFGPDILVAPVTERGARRRWVYLPAGADWTEAWSGHRHAGGQTIEAAAPLERIPVFMKGDAKLP